MTKYNNGPYPTGKNAVDEKKIRKVKLLGRIATIMCILMYVSYIPQIIANFLGHPVSPIQPLVAMINATLWTGYGLVMVGQKLLRIGQ